MATNEQALVTRAKRGDRRAFAALVTAHQARLIGAARVLVGDAEAAEDVSQEAFIEAFQSLPRLEHADRFRPWLFSILRHRALNHLRRRERDRAVPLTEETADTTVPPGANSPHDDLRAKLDTLPVRHREILAAKYLQELSYEEIAESLGLTVNAVRVRCHRAKEKLRELLSQGEPEPTAEGGGA